MIADDYGFDVAIMVMIADDGDTESRSEVRLEGAPGLR